MNLEIKTKSWKVTTVEDTGQKQISGEYAVMNGTKAIADKSFNGSYGGVKIAFPASILAKIEEIDEEIRQEVIKFFE